jgi:hypothetical protein
MKRLLDFVGMSLGSWLGWAVGSRISFFTAFLLSTVGTGFGLYAAIRLRRNLFP